MTTIFFGARYSSVGPLVTWLACFNAIRIIRTTSIAISTAIGDARLRMVSTGVAFFVMLAFYFISPEARKVAKQRGVYVRSKLGFADGPELR